MIMIVMLHTLGHGNALESLNIYSKNFIVSTMFKSLSIVAVNCYVLITGFFGINSTFNLRKVFKLYYQILFYSIIIPLIFWALKLQVVNFDSILRMIFPITMQTWWFISIYMVLYILTPYINKLIKTITRIEYNKLLIILFVVFIVWPSLIIKFRPIDISGGYSLYNFIFLYIVGSYIRIYSINISKSISIFVYILSSFLLCVFNLAISKMVGSNVGIYNYNFILIFISSVALFLFFKEVNIKSNFVNKLSSLTLGVYLIHDHVYIRQFIYKFFKYENVFYNERFIIYTIFVVISIYIVSSMIEYIRQCLFRVTEYKINNVMNFTESKIKQFGTICEINSKNKVE